MSYARWLEWRETQPEGEDISPQRAFTAGWDLGWALLNDHREQRIKELERHQYEMSELVTQLYDLLGRS
jgi:hypothetical protein